MLGFYLIGWERDGGFQAKEEYDPIYFERISLATVENGLGWGMENGRPVTGLDQRWIPHKVELTGFADGLDAGDEKRESKETSKIFGLSSWLVFPQGRVNKEQFEGEKS